MTKKGGKRKSSGKSHTSIATSSFPIKKKAMNKAELEEALLTNFVNLQKVLTNLSLKFEDLSDNISKLLQLFEISAKSFADKYSGEIVSDNDMIKKLDSLLDQNKTIAKGIMLMEERIKHKSPPAPIKQEMPPPPATEGQYGGMIRSKTYKTN